MGAISEGASAITTVIIIHWIWQVYVCLPAIIGLFLICGNLGALGNVCEGLCDRLSQNAEDLVTLYKRYN